LEHHETEKILRRLGWWMRTLRREMQIGRRGKKMAQKTVARRARCSRATVSAIEQYDRGGRLFDIHLDLIVGLAKAFDLRASDLIALCEAETVAELGDTLKRVEDRLGIPKARIRQLMEEGKAEAVTFERVLREAPSIEEGPPAIEESLETIALNLAVLRRIANEVSEQVKNLKEQLSEEKRGQQLDGQKES